ncbi:MAG: histidine kinase [Actinomycetota bacterium]
MTDIRDERARIARELHDAIAQDLAAIGYALDAEIGRSDTSDQSRKSLRAIREQITLLNVKVRDEIFQLRSERDQTPQEQLEATLNSLGVGFTIEGTLPPSVVGLELFKVIQELARNAQEHGGATHLTIFCFEDRIVVQHDGNSLSPINEGRFGIQGIAERLEHIGWYSNFDHGFTHIELFQLP